MKFNNVKKHIAIASASVITIAGVFLAYLSMNTQFDLIMPDNAGLYNVTLSSDNFSLLKQNVGVFTVYKPQMTTHDATSGYCRIAKFIHEHEDGYNNRRVGNSTIYNATMPPAWCDPELNPVPTPEFILTLPAFAIGTVTLMVFHFIFRYNRQ